jgi:HEAT repeat protein
MKLAILLSILSFSGMLFAARPSPAKKVELDKEDVINVERLNSMFVMDPNTPGLPAMLKRTVFRHKQKAVPTLIKVMKESKYPDQNRWQATMLLAQIMGKKAAPFIAKFADHPNWMMRVASLKALLGLTQRDYIAVYSKALRDPSLIVRVQALDNISRMNISSLGPEVWDMMYDQSNYTGEAGNRKRTSIVKSVIRTVGDIRYERAKRPLALLIQKPKYKDLMEDLDYSLEKITGENSPNEASARRKFWSKLAVVDKI